MPAARKPGIFCLEGAWGKRLDDKRYSKNQMAFINLIIDELTERAAAKTAFAEFLDDKRYSKNQMAFINLIIDELTERGAVAASRVYESPYDGIAPEGPEAIFVDADLDRIFATIAKLTDAAAV